MRIFKTIILCLCMILISAGLSYSKEWRGIMPLHSTRADVERLLGSPIEPRRTTYDTENERVSVRYSDGPCKKGVSEVWNVPRDTVISITIYPKIEPSIADFQIDGSKYKKVANPHREGVIYYINREEGVRFETFKGKVNSIIYTPPATEDYLRCPGAPAESDEDESVPPLRLFDEYSNIPFSDEKARLDNLAIYLQQKPEMNGYIIVYAGRRARAGEARARAERAKNYLVNERGIEAERIVAIDGGHRENLTVNLYIVPRGVSAPTLTPTVATSEVQIIRDGNARNNRRSSQARRKQYRSCQ